MKRYVIPTNWKIDFHGTNDNFNALLFKLIRKADNTNLEALRKSFPLQVAVYEAWLADPDEEFPHSVLMRGYDEIAIL